MPGPVLRFDDSQPTLGRAGTSRVKLSALGSVSLLALTLVPEMANAACVTTTPTPGTTLLTCTGTVTTNTATTPGGKVVNAGAAGKNVLIGNGGAGKNADGVTVDSTADITTSGTDSQGILATSTGGAGGTAAGGTGGAGGAGGAVNLTLSGSISTSNTGSAGVSASSKGGAGGNAVAGVGGAGATGGAVGLTLSGSITTTNKGSAGIAVSSQGGAGGSAGAGKGGAGGAGGAVGVTLSGSITTSATDSVGITASSQGGTGGNGGAGVGGNGGAAGAVTLNSSASTATSGDNSAAISLSSTGGAAGGTFAGVGRTGGAAGDVTANVSGDVSTKGSNSSGIVASSVGGKGGSSAAGAGGVGGAAGAVNVTMSANIQTQGDNSIGISASSTGGAGGSAAGGLASTGGQAGGVTVSNSGVIETNGTGAHGISATSTGGQGGDIAIGVGGSGGKGGTVSVTSTKDVTAKGADAHGILATSTGGAPGNKANIGLALIGTAGTGADVTVDVKSGSVTGGSGNSWGVYLSAGTTAQLTNAGTISALSGNAVYASGSSAVIDNNGTINGNVTIASTTSPASFNNNIGATFASGKAVDLGSTGVLTNAGTFSPAGAQVIGTTALTGNLTQTSSGRLAVDVDAASGGSDRINATGKAQLNGTVFVNTLNLASMGGLSKTFTIVTAAGGITDAGIQGPASQGIVGYSLVKPDAQTLQLKASVDFQGIGSGGNLTPNQINVASALNRLFESGVVLPFMQTMLLLPAGSNIGDILSQLVPISDGANFARDWQAGSLLANQLLSCRVAGDATEPNRFIKEGQCVWARVTARRLGGDSSVDNAAYSQNELVFSTGAQFDIGGPWRAGAGISYASSTGRTAHDAVRSDGEQVQLGGVIKYNPGPWLFAGTITGGLGTTSSSRVISFADVNTVASSSTDNRFYSARATAAYLHSMGAVYLKPQVEFAATHVRRDGYLERAGAGLGLRVDSSDATILSAAPSVELGFEGRADSAVRRMFVRGGAIFLDTDKFVTTAAFADAVGGPASFTVISRTDKTLLDVGAGIDLFGSSGTVLRLQYDGQFGEHTHQNAGSAKLSIKF